QLLQYHWPGNVRELEHVLSRAAIQALSQGMSRQDIVSIEADWLGLSSAEPSALMATPAEATPLADVAGLTLKQAVHCTQRQMIKSALVQHQQCWADAARALGVDASNLHKLAQKLGLKSSRELS
ncbi:MAG: nitric oxide reductase transcription regulator, partial [Alkalimonas sp.]|nr:nitric oxide reductase transcription regulator [Alkalimonas sp.]